MEIETKIKMEFSHLREGLTHVTVTDTDGMEIDIPNTYVNTSYKEDQSGEILFCIALPYMRDREVAVALHNILCKLQN